MGEYHSHTHTGISPHQQEREREKEKEREREKERKRERKREREREWESGPKAKRDFFLWTKIAVVKKQDSLSYLVSNFYQKYYNLNPPKFGLNFLEEDKFKNQDFMLLCGFEKFDDIYVRIDILERLFILIFNSEKDDKKENMNKKLFFFNNIGLHIINILYWNVLINNKWQSFLHMQWLSYYM